MTDPPVSRISGIATNRGLIDLARQGAAGAWTDWVRTYQTPMLNYLRGCLGPAHGDEADDAAQQILLRFMAEGFPGWNGEGRFRDYIRKCLRQLADQYRYQRGRGCKVRIIDPAQLDHVAEPEHDWETDWRKKVWHDAARAFQADGGDGAQVVELLTDPWGMGDAKVSSDELAARLGIATGKHQTPANARKILQRARERFAEQLMREMLKASAAATRQELTEELGRAGWLNDHVRRALDQCFPEA